jgi:hypothetical protein
MHPGRKPEMIADLLAAARSLAAPGGAAAMSGDQAEAENSSDPNRKVTA